MNKYNLSKYNVGGGGFGSENIFFDMDCHERVEVIFTSSLNMLFGAEGTEKLDVNVMVTHGIPFTQELHAELEFNARLDAHVVIEVDGLEELKSVVDIVKDTNFEIDILEEIEHKFYLGNDISFEVEVDEKFDSSIFASKDIITKDLFLSESLHTAFRTSLLNIETLTVNVSLRPGETLEIDSDLFAAYVGDRNVIDLYTGDWINLDRNTISVDIGSGSGGRLEGVMVFRERYL